MIKVPILSVIIPIYNVEDYLSRCLDSVLHQSFTDFEIILVDDGSKDNSGKICDEYALKDNRIKVVHQKNGGLAHARNIGIDHSKGDFLTFIDSDDEIEEGTFQPNMDILFFNSDIDILQFPEIQCKSDNRQLRKNYPSQFTSITKRRNLFVNWYHDLMIPGGIWGKFYKREIFNNYRFSEDLHFCEDLYCVPDLVDRIKCLSLSVYGGYLYHIRENSLCTSVYTLEKSLDVCRLRMRLFQTLYSFKGLELEKSRYFVIALRSLFGACTMGNDLNNSHIKQSIHFFNKAKVSLCFDLSLKEKIWIVLSRALPISLLVKMYVTLVHIRLKLKIRL